MKAMIKSFKNAYNQIGRSVHTFATSPSNAHIQLMLFVLGVSLLISGIVTGALADLSDSPEGSEYNATRINEAVRRIFTYLEGSFGVLVMVAAGLGAILSSAFGQYRAALGCLVVAVGSFILRSVASTFFNASDIFNE